MMKDIFSYENDFRSKLIYIGWNVLRTVLFYSDKMKQREKDFYWKEDVWENLQSTNMERILGRLNDSKVWEGGK